MARTKGSRTKFIDASQLEQLEQMAAVGLTLQQMAAILGMSHDVLEQRAKEDPNIKSSIEKGRSKAIFQVGKSAYQQAVSGKVPAMTMFYLKCRARWKETSEVEITGKDGEDFFKSFTDLIKQIANEKPQEKIYDQKPKAQLPETDDEPG